MSNFTPTVRQEFEFEGDAVVVVFKRLKRGDAYDVFLTDGGSAVEKGNKLMGLLPQYIVSFSGLRASDGVVLTLDQIIDEAYFAPLLGKISKALVEASNVGKKEAGNSPASPPESSPESNPASAT